MSRFFSIISPYWLWVLLALPAAGFVAAVTGSDDPKVYEELLHPTGEFSARFMIIAMLASPLTLILKGWRGPFWLKKNRRYFGVAAFGYAALHTLYYLIDAQTMARVFEELPRLYIWTGWVAFAIFIPLAVTSMDYFVRVMGPRWKQLQRWTYAAAVLTLIHWAALDDWGGVGPALVHFLPLGLLEAYRAWYWTRRRASRQKG
ncbi:MAG: ferric reductase-like transmembrane domain-containing protein [Pseudomonadota bacterium]